MKADRSARPAAWSRAALAAALGALAGCGGTAFSGGCTDIGATSGVLFEYDAVLHAHRGETLLVEACVEDTCDNVRVTRHDRRHAMVVAPDLIKDDTPVAVTLTISSPSGDIAFQGRRTVHSVKSQPNGPDCPPTAWFAQVYASGTDNLPERGPYSD